MHVERKLIGESPAFMDTMERVSRVAPLNKPVLIIGERGTGKELTAERLHYLSARWEQTLIKLNCAAVPETLLETELFGHEAGAFTGATKRHQGRFERADGGSMFLDEIASMSLRLQEKLLRVIEYGEYERVGGDVTLQVDVRIIGAANVDLPKMAERGEFRADLLDRLSFDVITLPPLSYRKGDVPVLAEHFAMGMVKELRRAYFQGFSEQAMVQMEEYSWPGNMRELRNVVERAVYRGTEGELIDNLEFDPFASPYRPLEKPVAMEAEEEKTIAPVQFSPGIENFKAHIKQYESDLLQAALERHRYNQRNTASALGLSYDQLRGYLRKYKLPCRSAGSRP
jgi:psp operon transcriptional activator